VHWSEGRVPALACGVLLLLALVGGLALQGRFPVSDNAMFEYVGRAITQHRALYIDVWDNKLPGVYYVDAAMQLLFGENYMLHATAEICVAFVSGALMAAVMRNFELRTWLPASTILTFMLCIVFPLNSTEAFALPLVLAAILTARRGMSTVSGALVALAATFWIPSLLTIVPIATLTPRSSWPSLALATISVLAAVVASLIFSLHTSGLVTLIRSWTDYLSTSPPAELHHRIPLLNRVPVLWSAIGNLWKGLRWSGAAVLLVLLIGTFRRPFTQAQRFGILWTIVALLGTLTGTGFYWHYFITTDAATIFTIAAYRVKPASGPRRLASVAVGAILAVASLNDVRHYWIATDDQSAVIARIGNATRPIINGRLTVQVDSYQPGFYLAVNPKLRSPYEIAAPANPKFLHSLRQTLADPQLKANTHGRQESGVPVCAKTAAPWRVFVVSSLAHRFSACP
jgi:hypothetical protein